MDTRQKFVNFLNDEYAKAVEVLQQSRASMPEEYQGFMDERICLLDVQKSRALDKLDALLVGDNEKAQFEKWSFVVKHGFYDVLSVSDPTQLCKGDTYQEYLFYRQGNQKAKLKKEY